MSETIRRLQARIDQLDREMSQLKKEIEELKKSPVMLLKPTPVVYNIPQKMEKEPQKESIEGKTSKVVNLP